MVVYQKSYEKTGRGEDLILFKSEKLIIFTTKNNLSILKQYRHWFANGTFKIHCHLIILSLIVSSFFLGILMTFISRSHCML